MSYNVTKRMLNKVINNMIDSLQKNCDVSKENAERFLMKYLLRQNQEITKTLKNTKD